MRDNENTSDNGRVTSAEDLIAKRRRVDDNQPIDSSGILGKL